MAEKTAKKVASARHTGDGSKSRQSNVRPNSRHQYGIPVTDRRARHGNIRPNTHQHRLGQTFPRRSTAPATRGFEPMAFEAMALPELPQPPRGAHENLGIIAGSDGPTGWLSAGATDLCEISPGGQVALAGDTFGETDATKASGAHRWACMSGRAALGAESSSTARLVGAASTPRAGRQAVVNCRPAPSRCSATTMP